MPQHRCISERYGGTLVEYDGIVHLILTGEEATEERFEELRAAIASELDPPAIGVMFCSVPSDGEIVMTPVVYVRDVGTVYWEGSCGSGSTAAAAACSAGRPDGIFRYTVVQPAGTLIVSTEVVKGETVTTWLEGKIRLYDPETVVIGSRPESAGASAGA
jgi:diaminopimelate epimerase